MKKKNRTSKKSDDSPESKTESWRAAQEEGVHGMKIRQVLSRKIVLVREFDDPRFDKVWIVSKYLCHLGGREYAWAPNPQMAADFMGSSHDHCVATRRKYGGAFMNAAFEVNLTEDNVEV